MLISDVHVLHILHVSCVHQFVSAMSFTDVKYFPSLLFSYLYSFHYVFVSKTTKILRLSFCTYSWDEDALIVVDKSVQT